MDVFSHYLPKCLKKKLCSVHFSKIPHMILLIHFREACHHLFETFQPICVRLAKEHTRENVQTLIKALDEANTGGMQELQEYVLFPLRIILKQPKKL